MPLRRSHKVALAAIGVIGGWISLSAVSNWKQIQKHDGQVAYSCRTAEEGGREVICRAVSCNFKYYFFAPFYEFLEDKVVVFDPKGWCVESIIKDMNK